MRGLEGKVAIVTGAARGIGETYARRLAREGAAVVVTDVLAAQGEAVAASIEAEGGRAIFLALDVSDEAACLAVVEQANATLGRIDYLVNNAAIFGDIRIESLLTMDIAYFEKVMRVNATGILLTSRAAAPYIAAQGGGAIVNQSSTAAYSIGAPGGLYGLSKLAVTGMTQALASELGPQNIRVNTLAPGATDTPALMSTIDEKTLQFIINGLTIKRMGTPDDQADALLFLLSDAAGFITGQVLCVDGGRTRRL
jgi:3-oxoacyl-[acyl-carrier protein] reductase